jgi:hypothetical protein
VSWDTAALGGIEVLISDKDRDAKSIKELKK